MCRRPPELLGSAGSASGVAAVVEDGWVPSWNESRADLGFAEPELEAELVEPVDARQVAQPAPVEQRTQRRLDRAAQPDDQLRTEHG